METNNIILWDCGKKRETSLHIEKSLQQIGSGTRANVESVLVVDDAGEKRRMAMKTFHEQEHQERADDAQRGYERLHATLALLSEEQRSRLIDLYVDTQNQRVFSPLLNGDRWVLSMGKNISQDRTELSQNKLGSIPNFTAFLEQFLQAVQDVGERGLMLGPDVYFFTIDHTSHNMDYVYADTETAAAPHYMAYESLPLMNLYFAGGALNDFLRECVADPDRYLYRVQQEVQHRMRGYPSEHYPVQSHVQDFNAHFTWPSLGWSRSFVANLAWFWTLFKRQVRRSWNS